MHQGACGVIYSQALVFRVLVSELANLFYPELDAARFLFKVHVKQVILEVVQNSIILTIIVSEDLSIVITTDESYTVGGP